jgi:hypothetical protein
LADRFIVTGDSVSMMTEVASLGKPLMIYSLPRHLGQLGRVFSRVIRPLHAAPGDVPGRPSGRLQWLGDALYQSGLVGYSRDLTAIHRLLIQRGLAVDLLDGFSAGGQTLGDELACVIDRVRRLLPG